jgi:hypothetical protein
MDHKPSWKIERLERSSSPWIRFFKEANEHYKNHQQGTWIYLVGIAVVWIATYFQLGISPLELSAMGIFALFSLAAYSAWRNASDALFKETDRNRFVLSTGHRRIVVHQQEGIETGRGFVHRIKMDSEKNRPIEGVSAIIQSFTKDGEEQYGGLNVQLPIYNATTTVRHGVSQFIEFVSEYEDGVVVLRISDEFVMGFGYAGRQFLSVGSNYELYIAVSGDDASTEAISLSLFRKSKTELVIMPL